MRVLLVANQRSGRGCDPADLAEALARAGADVVATQPLDALDAAAADGAQRVVVAGGDGSVAPAALLARELAVPLAVLPLGTANDFARALGLPRERERAIALALADDAALVDCELGCIDHARPFVNVASAGLASIAAHRARPLKSRLGPLAYAVGALGAGLHAAPIELDAQVDGVALHSGPCWQIVVAATGAFGGGSGIAGTDADDGLLDLVLIPAGSRPGLVRRAWGLRTHAIGEQRGVLRIRGHAITLQRVDDVPLELNVDGEIVPLDSAGATLTGVAGAFRCVAPASNGLPDI